MNSHDEALRALLRLRRMAVDEARRGLAACLQQKARTEAALAEIDAAIEKEAAAAAALEAGDDAVEAFGVWLKRVRTSQAAVAAQDAEAEERIQQARVVLAAAQAGLKAVEGAEARAAAERQAAAARQEQHALEDTARSYTPLPAPAGDGPIGTDCRPPKAGPCPTRSLLFRQAPG
jgi:flagellar biosynthesis chaperone FliJ